ncbi:ATP-dependent helicase HrpB [Thalassotalea ganghwensis]
MSLLPIEHQKSSIIQALSAHSSVLISAEPGAGKSTQIPRWLLDEYCSGKIYLVQPRRIAVKSLAYYLASQLGQNVGEQVGYRLRDDTCVSATTRLEVISEGILLQIIQNNPEMSQVACVILDEFHERSTQLDLGFALLCDVQQVLNESLQLVIMSATIESPVLLKHLPDMIEIECPGRSFPIQYHYQPVPPTRNWRQHALSVIEQAVVDFQESVLVFLPGAGDIEYLYQQLEHRFDGAVELHKLYGALTLKQQQNAIATPKNGQRKVVLTTNIAETSLTIEGVAVVIDCGYEKVACFNEQSLTNELQLRMIAKSSAIQRAGRAGRIKAGHCIRLFSEEDFERRPQQAPLAIQQSDILPTLIEAARWGCTSLTQLPLLDFPSATIEESGWKTLAALGIIDEKGRLSAHGQQVGKLSCHPRFAHMIIRAVRLEQQFNCQGLAQLACYITTLLENKEQLQRWQGQSNLQLQLEFLVEQQVFDNNKRLKSQLKRLQNVINDTGTKLLPFEYCGALLTIAYPERLAKARAKHGEFIAVNGKGLSLEPAESLASHDFIAVAQLQSTQSRLMIKLAASVDINLLKKWHLIEETAETICQYDQQSEAIVAKTQYQIGAITTKELKQALSLSTEDIVNLWQALLTAKGLEWLNWQKEDLQLVNRWRWLANHQPSLKLPDISESALLASMSLWFSPFVSDITTKKALDKLNLSEQLLSMLDYQQQQGLAKLAPTHYLGQTGRKCIIRYQADQDPIVSLPMQELYGMQQGPYIGSASNPQPLVLEILSPAQRPIQVTQNLSSFWQDSYRHVQKEMKSKYPKHYWPDDPGTAVATNKTKRFLTSS